MLKKPLSADLTLIKREHYPFRTSKKSGGKEVLLGIGGNIGDTVRRFEHLFCFLGRSALVHILESSQIVKNPPFGYTQQDYFYNAMIRIETGLTPKALLGYMQRIENKFGRKRSFKDAPRTLDIDIIFYENVTMQSKRLTLPHPGWRQRDSVLIPLSTMRGRVKWKGRVK